MNKCDKNRLTETEVKLQDFYTKQSRQKAFESEFGTKQRKGPWSKILTSSLATDKKANRNDILKYYRKKLKPSDAERNTLIFEINAILENNPHVARHMNKWMGEQVVSRNINVDPTLPLQETGEPLPLFDNGVHSDRPVVIVENLPADALRVFYNKLNSWINGGRLFKINRGIIGNLQYEWGTVREMQTLDNSGVTADVNEILEMYHLDATSWANQYIEPIHTRKGKKEKIGFKSIAMDLDGWAAVHRIPNDTAWKIYSEVMEGRTDIKENGALVRKMVYAQKASGVGFEWKQFPVETYKYRDENNISKELKSIKRPPKANIPDMFDGFVEIIKDSRYMFKIAGEEAVKEISAITKERTAINAQMKKNNLGDYIGQKIEEVYDGELEIAGLNAAELKKGAYYPKMYHFATIRPQIENSIEKQKIAAKDKQAELYNPDLKLTPKQRNKLFKDLTNHGKSIAIAEEKLLMLMDPDMSFDQFGTPVRASVWYKNFKNVSNMMDPGMSRTDNNVPFDYIQQLGQQITRNRAVVETVKAIIKAKKAGANENQIDFAVDQFNHTFYQRNAHAQFMGVDMSATTIADRLPINVSPEQVINFTSSLSSFTTSSLLYNPAQGIVNLSAMYLKSDLAGNSGVANAIEDMEQRKEFWQEEVRKAGLGTFTQFVNTFFNMALRPEERAAMKLEIDQMNAAIKKMKQTNSTSPMIAYRKKYIKKLESKQRRAVLDQVAQWIIARQNYYNKNQSEFKKLMKGTNVFTLGYFPDIASTEDYLRSVSYVMGVKRAVEKGAVTSETSQIAREYGKAMTMLVDFGLSHHNVGAAMRGTAGHTLNKMMIWRNQKSGFDFRNWKYSAVSRTPMFNKKGKKPVIPYNLRLFGNAARMVPEALVTDPLMSILMAGTTKGRKSRRLVQSEATPFIGTASASGFRQGIATAIFDLLLFAPGSTAMLNQMGIVGSAFKAGKSSILGNGMALRGLSGITSTLASMGIGVGALGYTLLSGDNDDAEWDEYASRWFSYTPFGVGSSMLYHLVLAAQNMIAGTTSDENYDKRHIDKVTRPVIVFPGLFRAAIDEYERRDRRKRKN